MDTAIYLVRFALPILFLGREWLHTRIWVGSIQIGGHPYVHDAMVIQPTPQWRHAE